MIIWVIKLTWFYILNTNGLYRKVFLKHLVSFFQKKIFSIFKQKHCTLTLKEFNKTLKIRNLSLQLIDKLLLYLRGVDNLKWYFQNVTKRWKKFFCSQKCADLTCPIALSTACFSCSVESLSKLSRSRPNFCFNSSIITPCFSITWLVGGCSQSPVWKIMKNLKHRGQHLSRQNAIWLDILGHRRLWRAAFMHKAFHIETDDKFRKYALVIGRYEVELRWFRIPCDTRAFPYSIPFLANKCIQFIKRE